MSSERRFRALLPEPLLVVGSAGDVLEANPAAQRGIGGPVVGQSLTGLASNPDCLAESLILLRASSGPTRIPLKLRLADGESMTLSGGRLPDSDGLIWLRGDIQPGLHVGMAGLSEQLRLMRQREDFQLALRLERERAQAMLAAISDAVISCDADGLVDYLNPAAEQLTGFSAEEAGGRPLAEVLPLSASRGGPALRLDPAEPLHSAEDELLPILQRADGRLLDVDLNMQPMRDGRRLRGAVIAARDATEQRRLSRQLLHEAEHDALTGLANRRAIERHLQQLIDGDAGGPHSALFIDLDHFKAVNDRAGHAAGDQLLRELAGVLRGQVRRGDLLARFGGDEFLVLLPNCPADMALRIAESLRRTVDVFDFQWQGEAFKVTASVGVIDFYSEELDGEQLLKEVDAACYAAKRGGRNQVSVVGSASSAARGGDGSHDELRLVLGEALASGALAIDGQLLTPAVPGSEHGGDMRLELLVRLPHPLLGQRLRPGQFFDLARQQHCLPAIDRWMLGRALSLLRQHPRLSVQLNVGEDSLRAVDYVDCLLQTLAAEPDCARRLTLELDEAVLLGGYPQSFDIARRLTATGAGLAVDGFRGGTAAVESLRRLPITQLKLDPRLVRAGAFDLIDRALVEAKARVAYAMGVDCVACGVESADDLNWLRSLPISWLQGHHLGRPQPVEALLDLPAADLQRA